MLNEFSKPLTGKRLKDLFAEHVNILFPSLVSDSPELATERAETFFGEILTPAANNITALTTMRDLIFDYANDKRIIDGFIIVLPHTHWQKRSPIIYQFDKEHDRYIIGPHPIDENNIYSPVSFTLYKGTVIPYEWVDSSVILISEELNSCLDIINSVASKYNHDYYPLGISINFRFKTSLFSKIGGTVELSEEDKSSPLYNYSIIIKQDSFERENIQVSLSQVAWHPYSDRLLELSEDETSILSELRTLLTDTNNPNERNIILANLETGINQKPS